jgi:hypothetical protein
MSEQVADYTGHSTEEILRSALGHMMDVATERAGDAPHLNIDASPTTFATSLGRISFLHVFDRVRVDIHEESDTPERTPMSIMAEFDVTDEARTLDLTKNGTLLITTVGGPQEFQDTFAPTRWENGGYSLESLKGAGSLPYIKGYELEYLSRVMCSEVQAAAIQPLRAVN